MAVVSTDSVAAWAWRRRYGDDKRFYELRDQILRVGLRCRVEVVESWNDLQLVLTPLPGWIDLCTPRALVEAWLNGGRYHVSVTKKAHRIYQDRWWAIYERWHGVETVIWIDRVRSGGSATLVPSGVDADRDILFLCERSTDENGEAHWYARNPLHVSM